MLEILKMVRQSIKLIKVNKTNFFDGVNGVVIWWLNDDCGVATRWVIVNFNVVVGDVCVLWWWFGEL